LRPAGSHHTGAGSNPRAAPAEPLSSDPRRGPRPGHARQRRASRPAGHRDTRVWSVHPASEGLMKHPLRLAAIVVLAIVPLAVRGSAQAPASLPSIELPPALARVLTDYEMAW